MDVCIDHVASPTCRRGPYRAVRVLEPGDAGGEHPGAGAGAGRCDVTAVADPDRIGEVLVQVVDVLDVAAVRGSAHRDEVEHGQVLDQFAQPDAAGVRAHGHP